MWNDGYKVIELYYPALGRCKYLYNGIEYDNAGSAILAVSKQATQDVWNMNSHLHTTETFSLSEDTVAHIPDIPLLDDVEWEYLSELTKERDRVRNLSNKIVPKCTKHEWVNISLMNIREVCKHCDVERKDGDK